MFWVDSKREEIQKRFHALIESGAPLVIRDEKTASGRVHVGSMRGVAVHGLISEALTEEGIHNTFLYEINDTDPMDGLPSYLDSEVYSRYMGQPLHMIPSPVGNAKNFAEYYALEFTGVIEETGFHPEYYRLSDKYREGAFNDLIKIALLRAADIRRIYKEVSGSIKPDDWYPLQVVCEQCGKVGTTKVTGFDGEVVSYTCMPNLVLWAKGCGHTGEVAPWNGAATFPWKVEWAAKFKVMNVAIEGAGKDHFTKGGSRDVSDRIAREIFNTEPPLRIPYEFFLFGGKKMSSSKGQGASAREVADLLPPHIFRLALVGKEINQQVNVDPGGDTMPLLFDWFDTLAEKTWSGIEDDDTRLFHFIHFPEERNTIPKRFLPRFSQIAYIVQMPHLDIYEEVAKLKGEALTDADRTEIDLRATYARFWIDKYADEQFKFSLARDTIPEATRSFSEEERSALKRILTFIEQTTDLSGEVLHSALHDIRKESGLPAKEFFRALYLSFLGKESGPKAGWFLSVIDREFLITRLKEVSEVS